MTYYRTGRGFILHAGPYTLTLDLHDWRAHARIGNPLSVIHVGPLMWIHHGRMLPF